MATLAACGLFTSPVSGLGAVARAQGWAAVRPVLHEPLPPPRTPRARTDRVVREPAATAGLPRAIQTAAGEVPRPAPGGDVPTYAPREPPRVGVDKRTGADLNLHYQMVFDPSIAPFKREAVFDAIGPDAVLRQTGAGREPLSGRQAPRPGHELFWGHVRVTVQPGESTPLPSVAPTSQILEWQATPPVALAFWRDRAGNVSVTAEVAGATDLRFLMDAPSDYFAAPIGVRSKNDDPVLPALDPTLQARVARTWPFLGVDPKMERGEVVMRLVDWFRAFAPGVPEAPTGDDLIDLVRGQKGVCRHRALGFLAVAHSLGIPAQYVMNDAHAFVEAFVPRPSGAGGWQRIDLGGGADSLELHGGGGRHFHQPTGRDPFPRPRAYAEAVGEVLLDGARVPQAWGGARTVGGAAAFVGAGGPGSAGASGVNGSPAAPLGTHAAGGVGPAPLPTSEAPRTAEQARQGWLRQRAMELAAPLQPPGAQRPAPTDARAPTQLTAVAAPQAWAGETLRASGRLVTAAGAPVTRQPVEVWLIDPRRPLVARMLGVAVTASDGQWTTEVAIPVDAALQVWDVVARFGGTSRLRPSDTGQW